MSARRPLVIIRFGPGGRWAMRCVCGWTEGGRSVSSSYQAVTRLAGWAQVHATDKTHERLLDRAVVLPAITSADAAWLRALGIDARGEAHR